MDTEVTLVISGDEDTVRAAVCAEGSKLGPILSARVNARQVNVEDIAKPKTKAKKK